MIDVDDLNALIGLTLSVLSSVLTLSVLTGLGDEILLGNWFNPVANRSLIHGLKFGLINGAICGVARIVRPSSRIIHGSGRDCRTLDPVRSFSCARVDLVTAIKPHWIWQHAIIH